jgi:hypothetical protein
MEHRQEPASLRPQKPAIELQSHTHTHQLADDLATLEPRTRGKKTNL